ncbi:MAG: beta-lactamase family protein [Alphaproteobacteria bacterium]|nr:beta-lactamase family protein [Alphaproteobacteria bacterium]
MAFITLKVEGPPEVTVSMAFAALDLEGKDACIAEASNDNGANWIEFNRVEDGGDDGFTLHTGAQRIASPTKGASFIVRLRVAGNGDNDTCWADNIRITARPQQSSHDQSGPRQQLSLAFLIGDERLQSPVAMQAYTQAADAQASAGRFEGKLKFEFKQERSAIKVLRDNFNFMVDPLPGIKHPPSFELDFVQSENNLIPTTRGLIRTDNEAWDLIVEPGRVWREPGDDGYTRAAVPFALQERNANCTHNGVLTFIFKPGGDISRAAYQIVSETCFYFQFDMWGVAETSYTPQHVANADAIVAAYKQEMSGKLPIKPIAELGADYPAIDPDAFAAPMDVTPEYLTTYGVVIEGVHYRGGCLTRYGPYPFCESVALPSYSTAKSVFAGLGMMRLEQLYPGAMNTLIDQYVPECAAVGWRDVTFGNALDMATGRYNSRAREADENASVLDGFFIVLSHADKIKRACTSYPNKSDPGQQWVYHTSDHYILGTAMQSFLRERIGDEGDIYKDLLVDPVWKHIGLSPVTYTTRRTRDSVRQPFVGWGLTYLPDDIAKFAQFIAVDGGIHDGAPLVNTGLLASALQEDKSDPGLPAPDKNFRYNNGFWAWNAGGVLQCDSPVWMPFMSGFGGVSVVLMPNDVIYYYVSDNQEFSWARGVQAADKYKPMCGTGDNHG